MKVFVSYTYMKEHESYILEDKHVSHIVYEEEHELELQGMEQDVEMKSFG